MNGERMASNFDSVIIQTDSIFNSLLKITDSTKDFWKNYEKRYSDIGWIVFIRNPCPIMLGENIIVGDGRGSPLSRRGKILTNKLNKAFIDIHNEILQDIDASQHESLITAMEHLLSAIEKWMQKPK